MLLSLFFTLCISLIIYVWRCPKSCGYPMATWMDPRLLTRFDTIWCIASPLQTYSEIIRCNKIPLDIPYITDIVPCTKTYTMGMRKKHEFMSIWMFHFFDRIPWQSNISQVLIHTLWWTHTSMENHHTSNWKTQYFGHGFNSYFDITRR